MKLEICLVRQLVNCILYLGYYDCMEEVLKKLEDQQIKIDAMYASVEKLRKYFLWTLIITVGTIVLPIIGMMIILPSIISSLSSAYGLGL